jgi:hypothetical protein
VSRSQCLGASALLLLGLAVVAAVRIVAPQGAPPLYDSFVLPSPYIYLHPSPGQQGAPTSASDTVPYTGQDVGPLVLATRENPPQAQLIVAAGSLDVPPGTHSLTVSITPVDPPPVRPPNGVIAGNAYRFTATTDSGVAVPLLPGHPATLVLRGPIGVGPATIDLATGGIWTPLATTPVAGPDIFAANTTQFGDAAVVAAAAAPSPPASDGRFGWLPWAAGAVAIVIAVAVLLGLLLARRRRRSS